MTGKSNMKEVLGQKPKNPKKNGLTDTKLSHIRADVCFKEVMDFLTM